MGCSLFINSLSFSVFKNGFVISVSTTPGQIQLTLILSLAYSNAQHFVRIINPAFAAEYASALNPWYAYNPASDEMLIIEPDVFCK